MRRKPQTLWAVVHRSGWINWGAIASTRRDVIAGRVELHRSWSNAHRFAHLTDAQFWRHIKRRNGISVRRVVLRVAK